MKKIPPGPVAEEVGKVMLELSTSNWHGCYDDSWQGLIVPEAFAHPAKFSHGLICRIVEHGLSKGYWKAGDTVADPFGGVALGGIICGYHGLNWTGIELEEKFVELGNRNLDLHRAKWKALGYDVDVQLVQGDSRNLAQILQQADAVVCSPPYIETQIVGCDCIAPDKRKAFSKTGEWPKGGLNVGARGEADKNYGSTPGQIGRLKAGSIDSVITSPPFLGARAGTTKSHPTKHGGPCAERVRSVGTDGDCMGDSEGQIGNLRAGSVDSILTSPPYAESVHNGNGIDQSKLTGNPAGRNTQAKAEGYGSTPGNLGNLKAGSISGIVTSPPYAGTRQDGTIKDGGGFSSNSDGPTTKWHTERNPANIGNLGDETNVNRETYWQAVAAIYEQCHQILKPGGVMVCVVKSYVKNKAIVPLPDDTLKLLGHIGFEPVERIHAMLVKESTERTFFGEVTKTNSRKSFFRRLCESKGSPKIDWEEVLFVRKSVTENKNIYYHEKRIVASGP